MSYRRSARQSIALEWRRFLRGSPRNHRNRRIWGAVQRSRPTTRSSQSSPAVESVARAAMPNGMRASTRPLRSTRPGAGTASAAAFPASRFHVGKPRFRRRPKEGEVPRPCLRCDRVVPTTIAFRLCVECRTYINDPRSAPATAEATFLRAGLSGSAPKAGGAE